MTAENKQGGYCDMKRKLRHASRWLAVALSLTLALSTLAFAAGTTTPPASGTAPSGTPPTGGTAPSGTPPTGGGGGADTMTYDYSGTLSGALSADGTDVSSDGETTAATASDQNAALVQNGGTLTVKNGTLTKSGDDDNGDNCNFYGVNSIVLAVGDGSTAYVSGSSLSAESEGSNGIFATDGATVFADQDTIATTAGNSRGLDATYGGTIIADDLDISTQGDHCASLATDRGGGSISVTNSTLSTAGSGSPLLYSTGDIEVDNVTGTASGSQLAGMEGLNTIRIDHSDLTSTITSATASDPVADGVIIYQSTSGDAEASTGEAARFEVSNSTLTSAIESGAMFYLTNTTANIVLSNTTLNFDSSKVNLLTVAGNDANNWGTAGSNGATVGFTALGETISGNIDVDTISTLRLALLENTVYTGAVSISENAVNTSVSEAPVTVSLDATSKWVVTADSTVTNLNAAAGAAIVDEDGNTVTILVNGTAAVTGTGSRTVTVTGAYATTVTTDDTNALSTDCIDRTAFDAYYATSTAFHTNGSTASGTDTGTTVTVPSAGTETAASGTAAAATSFSPAKVLIPAAVVILLGAAFWIVRRRRSGK